MVCILGGGKAFDFKAKPFSLCAMLATDLRFSFQLCFFGSLVV